jgi:hypothetical protein
MPSPTCKTLPTSSNSEFVVKPSNSFFKMEETSPGLIPAIVILFIPAVAIVIVTADFYVFFL